MRKLIIKSAFVAAFIAVAGYTAYNSQKEVELSDLAMENVEALADEEWTDGNCWWVTRYTICNPYGIYKGCPCGSHG